MSELKQVDLGYACYDVEVEDGVIVNAPPIAKWAKGKSLEYFEKWVARKRGRITNVTRPCAVKHESEG